MSKLNLRDVYGKLPVIHSLRHTWASLLAAKGVALPAIQKLLGHSDPKTTLGYIHVDGADARVASNMAAAEVAVPLEGLGRSR